MNAIKKVINVRKASKLLLSMLNNGSVFVPESIEETFLEVCKLTIRKMPNGGAFQFKNETYVGMYYYLDRND